MSPIYLDMSINASLSYIESVSDSPSSLQLFLLVHRTPLDGDNRTCSLTEGQVSHDCVLGQAFKVQALLGYQHDEDGLVMVPIKSPNCKRKATTSASSITVNKVDWNWVCRKATHDVLSHRPNKKARWKKKKKKKKNNGPMLFNHISGIKVIKKASTEPPNDGDEDSVAADQGLS